MMSKHSSSRRPRVGGRRRGVIATALAALALSPALAGAIVVPDEAPTIQAGINSGADEVLVRPGFYPETIMIDHEMTLRGLHDPSSSEIPELRELILDDTHQHSSHSGYLTVSDLHFRGQVRNVFHQCDFSGPYHLDFVDCVMDSGVTDQTEAARGQVFWSFVRCRITGGVRVTMPQSIELRDNTIQGPVQVAASAYQMIVQGNSIEGPGPCGISAGSGEEPPTISGNTVRGFEVGMHLSERGTDVMDNLVEGCSTAGIVIYDAGDWGHWVTGNIVRFCGAAITVNRGENVRLLGNVVEDCGSGILATVDYYAEVRANRVSRCGTGITIGETSSYSPGNNAVMSRGNVIEGCGGGLALSSNGTITVDRDTVIGCAAGIRLQSVNSTASVDSAFVLSCGGPGITIDGFSASATRCVVGRGVADGIVLSAASTVTLSGNTSFLNGGSGFVVHNTGTASGTVAENVGFGNARYGLTADPGTALGLSCNDWLGNPAGATAGLPPGATDLALNPIFCDLQANDAHLAPGSPLVNAPGCGLIGALGAGCANVATTGVVEPVAAPRGFSLARIGPVPTTGRIALELTLPRAAAIEVTVHDVQGRTVARLAGGEWTAGRHAIEWNGEGGRGRLPPGLYLIRYRFPGGQDSRRIVISR